MKLQLILPFLLAMNFASYAQEIAAPEFNNSVMYVKKDNTLADLDKTDLSSDLHTSMTGRSEVNIKAVGTNASITHSGGPTNRFIVKLKDAGTDPESVVELFKFKTDKKTRKILVAGMSMGKDVDVELPKQKLNFKKMSDGVYIITVKDQLEPGEYAFIVNRPNISIMSASSPQSIKGFCFGVSNKE